ncbi:hypothetical protein AJ78_07183, partial [Emergomyces pasteurianus Ep9510]
MSAQTPDISIPSYRIVSSSATAAQEPAGLPSERHSIVILNNNPSIKHDGGSTLHPASPTEPVTLDPLQTSFALSSALSSSSAHSPSLICSHISPTPSPLSDTSAFFAMATFIGRLFVFLFHVVPSVLYWVITFTTITIPTWLFTLFSMSLTFTMNFTT